MKIKTASLIGAQLDWAVAKCEGGLYQAPSVRDSFWMWPGEPVKYSKCAPYYSTDWAQGGPIIEREHIGLTSPSNNLTMFWTADIGLEGKFTQFDHSPLVAAMRCYVASKLGDEIEIPEALL